MIINMQTQVISLQSVLLTLWKYIKSKIQSWWKYNS